jgi:sugar phosphate isomerase/epimerase
MIALSTAYNVSKHTDPERLVDEISSLGFSAVELNVEVPKEFIPVIARRLRIASVHNYCPRVAVVPSGRTIYSPFVLSAADDSERNKAVELTLRTIDVASDNGAEAIVIHSGEVEMGFTGRMLARHYNESGGANGYGKILGEFIGERAAKSGKFLDNVVSSLDKILNYALKKEIKLGIENRFWANEIPSIDEMDVIFEKLDSPFIGLWYDVGHSVIAEKQGLVSDRLDFMRRHNGRTIGIHLHDVAGVYDHKAPGTGEYDFRALAGLIEPGTLLVNETHAGSAFDDLKNSTKFLNDCGIA